jgi:murein DD-endopeptidase MepM/ murein hydrolase activator NlpD
LVVVDQKFEQVRMMFRKKITFWFFPDTSGISKHISIRKAWLYYIPAAVVVLLFTSFFSLSTFFGDRVNKAELDRLRSENRQLSVKYEKLRMAVADASGQIENLAKKEIAIRSLFNIPDIAPAERELGTGGPIPAGLLTMSETEQRAYATEGQVDRLLKQAQFQYQQFSQVESSLGRIRERLDHTPSIYPTRGNKSRGFGVQYDPFTGTPQMHKGVDLAAPIGTPVVVTARGQVAYAGYDGGGLGNLIVIDHGFGFLTRYGHLSKILVRVGQQLGRGDLIGLVGTTGYSTGSHLHYEVWRNGTALDPSDYLIVQHQM